MDERTTGHWPVWRFPGIAQVLAIFVDRAHRRGSYTYGLNHKIMTFQIWSSPTNDRSNRPARLDPR